MSYRKWRGEILSRDLVRGIMSRGIVSGEGDYVRTPWQETTTILLVVAKTTFGYKKGQRRKPWISNETFALIKLKQKT